jgi:hypothetical protein
MTDPALDCAALRRAPARIAQLEGAYDSKTGQAGQTGHGVEYAQELRAVSGRKARSYDPKLATIHRPIPAARDDSRPIGVAHVHPQRAPAP